MHLVYIECTWGICQKMMRTCVVSSYILFFKIEYLALELIYTSSISAICLYLTTCSFNDVLQGTAAGNLFTIQGLLKDRANKQFMQNKHYILSTET